MSEKDPVVVVGAGHGGVQAVASLREEGYDGPVTLIGDEPDHPYHRPPLSKSYVTDAAADLDPLRGPSFFDSQSVEFVSGDPVTEISGDEHSVRLESGRSLGFHHLVLAVGSRNRRLPIPGADLDGVLSLRTAHEARELRQRLGEANHVVVIGGGFIGMEFAAAAAKFGAQVTLLEAAPRTMARVVSEQISQHLEANQHQLGVRLGLGAGVSTIEGRDGRVVAVTTDDGSRHPADLVLVGIGAQANSELAAAAGIRTGAGATDGVVVDERLLTNHPAVSAIGDCARFPMAGGAMRLESVQNAVDQARYVAARITGSTTVAYERVPWFWSDQGSVKLQIAGLGAGVEQIVVRGDPAGGKFSLIGLSADRVIAVESVNKPGDHMAARKLLAAGATLTAAEAADTSFPLKEAVARATAAA